MHSHPAQDSPACQDILIATCTESPWLQTEPYTLVCRTLFLTYEASPDNWKAVFNLFPLGSTGGYAIHSTEHCNKVFGEL